MSLFAGKRGAKVTTDIADKGKQWFFTSLPQSPPPPPPILQTQEWVVQEPKRVFPILFRVKLINY